MSLIDKAKELSGQAAEKVGDLGGDDLITNTIIRVVNKKDRINSSLEEKGCDYRISGIEVENGIPPKVTVIVKQQP